MKGQQSASSLWGREGCLTVPGVKEISSAIKTIRAANGMMPLAALSHYLYNPNPQITNLFNPNTLITIPHLDVLDH